MTAIPDVVRSILAFVVVLGVLVFVHELGHYLAARWRGIRVEVFSIGFGQALTSWTDRHGTVWKLAWLPLGGYVKMHGQERPEDVPQEVRDSWIAGETFQGKSVASRAIVVAAGPFANFLLAVVVFAGLFLFAGRPVTLPVVAEVLPASAAAQAGMLPNDRIMAIDGKPIQTFGDLQKIVSTHPGDTLRMTIVRGDTDRVLPVTIGSHEADGHKVGLLGIKGGAVTFEKIGVGASLWGGVTQTWMITRDTLAGVAQMLSGSRGTEELGGPLRIAQMSGEVAQLGIASLISFIAVLSVNLGLINLFPIPVLDGGHLVFYAVEAVLGRPLSPRAQEYAFRSGLAVLAGLFVFATWNDLSHIGLFRWVAGLMG
ncbi:RIP metalloprotease RseP [Rhodopila sp.]|uniref:RIP metalloprotease RseP n=1 Tax=Rhodopila sp. TaxID=2480087 RepID=UPI002C44C6F3|nr:RIP metalloprotease RseP [Rhodopila sp.]HVZ07834.1 RIP metalloprotease RseP [Rhodopila sp.]